MLTLVEKILFALTAFTMVTATFLSVHKIITQINSGHGRPDWRNALKRLPAIMTRIAVFQPVLRYRLATSLIHVLVGWGFGYFLLVNVIDILRAYITGFEIPGMIGNVMRLLADLFSAGILSGMIYFLVRRFVFNPGHLTTRGTTRLHPKARFGIQRDSAIVGGFVLFHVGARLIGESFLIAASGGSDTWQPFGNLVAALWRDWSVQALTIGEHAAFWIASGLILAFLPYFSRSKHIHLFIAPLNHLLKPERRSIGELNRLNFEDDSATQFGVAKLENFGWEQLMDAYACIMCFRCQEVCPAYGTGKVLSPAALEINKRYQLNSLRKGLLADLPETALIPLIIDEEAIWACTSCGACVDICPVNNEPMRDIFDMRRSLVLMENTFPKQLEAAFRGMERSVNPWNIPPTERMKWAEGLRVPTIEENPRAEILWWVGCAPASDGRAQKTSRAFAEILNSAGVSYAVLGQREQCSGDSARRAGNEYLFNELATSNVKILNEIKPKRIVTTCPHCLHTLKNEYPAFGGNYEVIHHSQMIQELISQEKIVFQARDTETPVTFHDPCYLGRHNRIFDPPREALKKAGVTISEMERNRSKSFCCGAGGGQMWKEEEHGTSRVNKVRLDEAIASGADTLAVACPFCMVMLNDAAKAGGDVIKVMDIAEIVAERWTFPRQGKAPVVRL